jgi:tetratricopeptide (TPR) repeat protein
MTEEIARKLSRLRGLAVTAHNTTSRYKGSERSAKLIGAELGATYLLEGSVRRADDRIRVSATLVRTADERRVWTEDFEARYDDIFAVQEKLATRIVEALDVRLGPGEARSLQSWGTRSTAAYDEYLRGQVLVEQEPLPEKLELARGHFERASQIDPLFASALAGLASTEALVYRNLDDSPEHLARAKALLERSLAADPNLVQALLASGDLRGATFDYAGAAQRYRQVVALDPRNYVAWDGLCWALGYLPQPQTAEAESACRRAMEINPGYAWAPYHLARVLIQVGRIEEAERALALLKERLPQSLLVDAGKFWLAMGVKRPRDALAALDGVDRLTNTNLALAWKAMALAQIGDLERSFALLDDALARGYRDFASLRTDPSLEPLRRDPRFARLLAQHGILSPEVSTNGLVP